MYFIDVKILKKVAKACCNLNNGSAEHKSLSIV